MPFAPKTLDKPPCSDFRVKTVSSHTFFSFLAMIKCSICSYRCDNWYVSNWRLACYINFLMRRCLPELAWGPSCVAVTWHWASGSTPYGATAGNSRPDGWNDRNSCHHTCINFISHAANTHALGVFTPSQGSLHCIPIFRLLLKIACVQCDFHNFWGGLVLQLQHFHTQFPYS